MNAVYIILFRIQFYVSIKREKAESCKANVLVVMNRSMLNIKHDLDRLMLWRDVPDADLRR
jgi:hypothetical protein